jgi:hypothetical protein
VTKKCRLGGDLGVQKPRLGLKRDRQQLVQPMKPARRMVIAQRNREDQSPRQPSGKAAPVFPARRRPATDHMIALIDGFQQRFEMLVRPGFFGRRHEHERQRRSCESALQRTTEAILSNRDDPALDGPPGRSDQIRQGRNDCLGGFSR